MSRPFEDLTGQQFGILLVVGFAGRRERPDRKGRLLWLCRCDCGKELVVLGQSLRSGATKSCGCLIGESTTKRFFKHGYSPSKKTSRTYNIYYNMKRRCYNPKDRSYHNYGGRGVKVCDRWLEGFPNFLEDMGECPGSEHSIDRIDNNGDYCKENCKWSTRKEQNGNRRDNVRLEYNGKEMILSDWVKELDIGISVLRYHLKKGKTLAEIIDHIRQRGPTNVWLEYNGKKMIMADWARELGVTVAAIRAYLKKGKSFGAIVMHYREGNKRKRDLTMTYEGMENPNGNIETNT